MATGTSYFNSRSDEFENFWDRGTAIPGGVPAGLYIGAIGAPAWASSTAYTVGQFCVSTHTGNCRLFKCTTAGTSGAADPFSTTGTETVGQTVADNTAVWTEQTNAIENQADAAAFLSELSGNGYARVSIGLADFNPAAAIAGATSTGASDQNSAAINFAAATGAWSPIVGFFTVDAATNGRYIRYWYLTSQLAIASGQYPSFAVNAITQETD